LSHATDADAQTLPSSHHSLSADDLQELSYNRATPFFDRQWAAGGGIMQSDFV